MRVGSVRNDSFDLGKNERQVRYLLDSLGCALGGYQQEDVEIALDVLDEVAGPGPATVITRSIKPWPFGSSWPMAARVPTLLTTTPIPAFQPLIWTYAPTTAPRPPL